MNDIKNVSRKLVFIRNCPVGGYSDSFIVRITDQKLPLSFS